MTKILKKSLACLLAFALCFTAVASCLAVSAAAPAMASDVSFHTQSRPGNHRDDHANELCVGEKVRAQITLGNIQAGSSIGIEVDLPTGLNPSEITYGTFDKGAKFDIVSKKYDEETGKFTMILDVTTTGDYVYFVYFIVGENVPQDRVFSLDYKIEATFASEGEFYKKTSAQSWPMRVFAEHVVETLEAVAPGCETTGLTEGSHCARCLETFKAQEEVEALGHKYDDGVINPDAGCESTGTKTFTCVNGCGTSYTEVIDPKGHTPAADLVDNKDGTHSEVCDVCGAKLSTAEHDFTNGDCACGAKEAVEIVPEEDASIVVRDTGMLINATLDMRVRVRKSVIPADCVKAKVIVTPTVYDGSYNPTAGTAFVETFEMATASSNLTVIPTNFSLFALDLPMYVKIECYDANDNLYKYSPTYTYYPAEELKKQYNASASTDSAKKLNTLITDMLNMSAAAQVYFADNAGASSALKATVNAKNFVNKDWPQEYASTTEPAYNTINNLGDANTNTLRLGADLSGAPVISYSVRNASTNLTDKSKLRLTVSYTSYYAKAAGGEVVSDVIEGDEWNKYYTGKHINYNFVDCAMYDGNKTVTFSLTYDGVEVVHSEYSLETYIAETAVNDSNLSKCLKAMGIFGASARAYFSTLGTVDPA